MALTTKEYLSQIGRLNKTIENKLAEISQLRTIAYNASSNAGDTERVQTSHDQDKLGKIVSEIVDAEKEVNMMISKRRKIVSQIEGIKNTYLYDMLYKHYVLGKDFKFIAVEQDKTMRHIGRMHDKALREFEKKYGTDF